MAKRRGYHTVVLTLGTKQKKKYLKLYPSQRVKNAAEELLPGVERIWLPGEQSQAKRIDRTANGFPILAPRKGALKKFAAKLGVEPLP